MDLHTYKSDFYSFTYNQLEIHVSFTVVVDFISIPTSGSGISPSLNKQLGAPSIYATFGVGLQVSPLINIFLIISLNDVIY